MADASSIRKASTLPSATGAMASSIRYKGNELWFANGTSWQPLQSRYGQRHVVTFQGTAGTTAAFFVADRAYTVVGVKCVHSVAGGSGCTVQVVKDTSTNAPGGGTNLLSAALALTGAANTVQSGALVTTAATLALAAGDRLSAEFAGTAGSLAGVKISVIIEEAAVTPVLPVTYALTTGFADAAFFVADRAYQVLSVTEYHDVIAEDTENPVTVQVTKDVSTDAPGGGTDLLSSAFSLVATARTVQTGALTATASSLVLAAGDRLSVDFAGVLTGAAGVVITVVLQPL